MNLKYYLLGFLGLTITTGCNDFLDLKPISEASYANYYKNESDIESALTGCYSALKSNDLYGQCLMAMTELRSDNIEDINPGGSAGIYYFIDRFTVSSGNDVVRKVWKALYNQIYRCNNVLAYSNVVDDEKKRYRYEGEASFLRALAYFNIVRLWGDAPMILTPIKVQDAIKYERVSIADIYNNIEIDLKYAIEVLDDEMDEDNLGRATSVAASALLGKVYITQRKWNEAVTLLDNLIDVNKSKYGLLTNIADVFSTENEMNKEILFAIRWSKTIVDAGHGYNDYLKNTKTLMDLNLPNGYEDDDERKKLIEYKVVDENNHVIAKYYDTFDQSTSSVGFDIPLLRWSDVLLMAAEAHNEIKYDGTPDGKAMKYLNEVRGRAKASILTSADLPGQYEFRNAVLQERRLEFPFELHRWFDLIRTDTAIEAMAKVGLTITKNDYLYPIPKTEVDLVNNPEKFPQNPGYN